MPALLSSLSFFLQGCTNPTSSSLSSPSSSPIQSPTNLTPPGAPVVVTATQTKASVVQPILANRIYLDSLFTNIFGPSARSVNTSSSSGLSMQSDGTNHGSPCSVYENYSFINSSGVKVQVDSINTCSIASESLLSAHAIPDATVTRQALLLKACSELTTSDTTLNYALAQINSPGIPSASAANVLIAFHLFYRTQPDPSSAVEQSLLALFPTPSAPTLDNWRDLLYTVCISSFWQVL